MSRPPSLIEHAVGGSYICPDWELRVTARCLEHDLGYPPGSPFEAFADVEIIKTFIKDRKSRVEDRSQVSPLTCGCEVWVLARGNDHRGGTWFDEVEEVCWLLAYRLHRSGTKDDFFPYCKGLDADDKLLPTGSDYTRLFRERDRRFVDALRIEVPLILREARGERGELRRRLGGDLQACISVEVDEELGAEALYVAFKVGTIDFDRVPVVLAAFHARAADWDQTERLPSREADDDEVVFTCTRETGPGAEPASPEPEN